MATPIPCLIAQMYIDTSMDLVTVANNGNTGTASLSTSRWYYYVSNRTTASNGQSFLTALDNALTAAAAAATPSAITGGFACVLTSDYKLRITHVNANDTTITLESSTLATRLGFTSASISAPSNLGTCTATASYISRFFWSPDMPVSATGPEWFDPAISYGIPSSAGSAQRSSDMTAAYTDNGTQYDAEYTFNGVEYYYKIRAQSGYTNQDLEGFWEVSLKKGRRVLWWRDRDNTVGQSGAPSEGSATPYNYIEYQPQPLLREKPPFKATAPPRLTHWDVSFPLWVTENGESPMSD